ncbi:MAG: hypothetical protein AB7P94_17340 [Steroidobacteraceae bacterium]
MADKFSKFKRVDEDGKTDAFSRFKQINQFESQDVERTPSYAESFVGSMAPVVSFGLAAPITAALKTTTNQFTDNSVVKDPRSIPQQFVSNLDQINQRVANAKSENPATAFAGDLAGFVSPGSLSGKAFNAVESNIASRVSNPILSKFLGGAAASGVVGQGLSDKKLNDQNRITDFIINALTGGAISGGLQAGGTTLNKAKEVGIPALRKVGEKLATSNVPQTEKIVSQSVRKGNETLGEEMARRGIFGFKDKVLKLAEDKRKDFGNQLGDLLDSYKGEGINPSTIVKPLEDLKNKYIRLGQQSKAEAVEKRAAEWVSNISSGLKTESVSAEDLVARKFLTPAQANILKREFATNARSAFNKAKFDSTAASDAEFSKVMSDTLRSEIEKLVPKSKLLNKEYHFYDDLASEISKSIAKSKRSGVFSIKNPLTTGGAALGASLIGGVPGALGAAATVQASKSFPVQTYLASLLVNLGKKSADEVTAEALNHPTIKKAIFDALSKAVSIQQVTDKTK